MTDHELDAQTVNPVASTVEDLSLLIRAWAEPRETDDERLFRAVLQIVQSNVQYGVSSVDELHEVIDVVLRSAGLVGTAD